MRRWRVCAVRVDGETDGDLHQLIWRTGSVLVVELDTSYVVIDETGAVTGIFEPRSYSDEDDLWRWHHVVVEGRFLKRTTVETRGECRHEDELVLEGLMTVDDVATRTIVSAALAGDQAARAEARGRAQREGAARVAAIPRALEDHGLGEELARAQTALADRVRWYADPIAAALLGTLVALAEARPDPSVITAYARGCLHACFVHTVAPVTAATAASHPALAAEIASRARDLEREAEHSEQSDASSNARTYRAGAAAVWLAAKALDPRL